MTVKKVNTNCSFEGNRVYFGAFDSASDRRGIRCYSWLTSLFVGCCNGMVTIETFERSNKKPVYVYVKQTDMTAWANYHISRESPEHACRSAELDNAPEKIEHYEVKLKALNADKVAEVKRRRELMSANMIDGANNFYPLQKRQDNFADVLCTFNSTRVFFNASKKEKLVGISHALRDDTGIRCYSWITSLFMRLCCKIIQIEANVEVIDRYEETPSGDQKPVMKIERMMLYLNAADYQRWYKARRAVELTGVTKKDKEEAHATNMQLKKLSRAHRIETLCKRHHEFAFPVRINPQEETVMTQNGIDEHYSNRDYGAETPFHALVSTYQMQITQSAQGLTVQKSEHRDITRKLQEWDRDKEVDTLETVAILEASTRPYPKKLIQWAGIFRCMNNWQKTVIEPAKNDGSRNDKVMYALKIPHGMWKKMANSFNPDSNESDSKERKSS
ncbi:MAG: hypothetical protein H0X51_01405 [Parachlamydiaceae bacterium]|nr:hypothetical protein [Parachlamydiaceae bacterium]